jgi:site-specific recombinase XerD
MLTRRLVWRTLEVMDGPRGTPQVETWLASLASPNTQAAYRNDLALFLAWCEARQISPLHASGKDAEQFRSDLVTAGAQEATAKRRASAVHSFLRADRPTEGETGPAAGHGTTSTVLLNGEDRARLLSVLPEQSAKAQVLIGLLLLDGLKLDEILDLDVADISGQLPHLDVSVTRNAAAELFTLHPGAGGRGPGTEAGQ